MKTANTILMLFIAFNFSIGQSDTIIIRYISEMHNIENSGHMADTIIYETPWTPSILYGTTILPWTENQSKAKLYGLFFTKVEIDKCKELEGHYEINKIHEVHKTDSSLTIRFTISGNCCHSFLCDLEVVRESIINLIQYGFGPTYCACICSYEITYSLSIMEEFGEFDKLQKVMINGNMNTLKDL